VTLLRQIKVEVTNGKSTPQGCLNAQILAQRFCPGRREVGR
jgi:hypothetical protein